jgi:hypothetical protein
MVITFLEKVFFERGNLSSSDNSRQSNNFLTSDDIHNNITRVIMMMLMMPFTIPYRIFRYFLLIPIRFADESVEMVFRKLKMTKGETQSYVKKLAKKQVKFMRNLCLILLLTLAVFSVSFGVSSTIYAGVYFYLIPCQTQDL